MAMACVVEVALEQQDPTLRHSPDFNGTRRILLTHTPSRLTSPSSWRCAAALPQRAAVSRTCSAVAAASAKGAGSCRRWLLDTALTA